MSLDEPLSVGERVGFFLLGTVLLALVLVATGSLFYLVIWGL